MLEWGQNVKQVLSALPARFGNEDMMYESHYIILLLLLLLK